MCSVPPFTTEGGKNVKQIEKSDGQMKWQKSQGKEKGPHQQEVECLSCHLGLWCAGDTLCETLDEINDRFT